MEGKIHNLKSVFVSYSSLDESEVFNIVDVLKESKISYFKAPESIHAGSNYAREIPKAIKECQIFLLVISGHSMKSVWVEKEIDCAINNRKIILPVQISAIPLTDIFKFYLNNVQIIKYFENPVKGKLQLAIRLDMLLKSFNSPDFNNNTLPVSESREEREMSDVSELSEPQGSAISEDGDNVTSGLDKEIEEIERLRARKNNLKQVVSYISSEGENERPNMFLREREDKANPRKAAERMAVRKTLDHREFARRNNVTSVNHIPEECEKCGSELNPIHKGSYKCVRCGFINYDYFHKIKNYLAENGARTAIEISDATNIDRKIVEYYLLEEHLEIPKWSDVSLVCQGCGVSIRSGRLCEKCKKENIRKSLANDEIKYRHLR